MESTVSNKTQSPVLTGDWELQNKRRLEKLIAEKAFAGNYAVFDWDFTCIFYDVQDSLLLYQLEHLCFNLTPEQFAVTIRYEIPQNIPLAGCFNSEGRQLTAADLAEDLDARYRFLYHSYKNLNGTLPLEAVLQTEEYLDFKTKMLMLTWHAVTVCDTDISQSICTGMTLSELNSLVEKTIAEALAAEIKQYTLVSPARQAGKAGVVTTAYRKDKSYSAALKSMASLPIFAPPRRRMGYGYLPALLRTDIVSAPNKCSADGGCGMRTGFLPMHGIIQSRKHGGKERRRRYGL